MISFMTKWYEDYKISEKTIKSFWKCFDAYKLEEPEEYLTIFPFEKEHVTIEFEKVAYEVDIPNFSKELISVYINIFVNNVNVGWFKQQYHLDGTPYDEFFVIE